MPYPSQVNKEDLLNAAWALADAEGQQALTLATLAKQFGVKSPSLYRYIPNKAALVREVNAQTETLLYRALFMARNEDDSPTEQLIAMSDAYWRFAIAHPRTYAMAFTTTDPAQRPDTAGQTQAILPVQAIVAQLTGEANSLAALRGVLALMHGYVMLVTHEQLRRGGDLEADYRQAVKAYLKGWSAS